MWNVRSTFRLFLIPVGLTISACSGGAGLTSVPSGAVSAPVQAPAPASADKSLSSINIVIGKQSQSETRTPMYISPAMKSMTVTAEPVGSPAIATTVNCTTNCAATLLVPNGSTKFTIALYDTAAGVGNTLSVGSTTQTIVAGQANNVAITLRGVAASFAMTLPATPIIAGQAATLPVTLVVKDAGNNVITGPLFQPATLAISDTSGSLSLSTTTIADPSTPLSLVYSGGTGFTGGAISATIPGVAASAAPSLSVIPSVNLPVTFTIR